ncbi:MAG TPA: hypothetical protein VF666_10580 [Pyrinomonadaceae bacterium]|jgi:hypothetical protein
MMSTAAESKRTDILLTLALAFDDAGATEERGDGSILASPSVLSTLGEAERLAVERRAAWYAKLPYDKQAQWLAHVLGRVRPHPSPLDENVHHSHVVEILRHEPPRIQELILRHLPPTLAASCAQALLANAGTSGQTTSTTDADEQTALAPEVMDVVRRTFLSNFVSLNELANPRHLDALSGVEVARLIHLLGVRETAIACRGIKRAEAVGSFLRRFPAEDARAIATHIATLISVEPQRVAIAERLVHEALSAEPEPSAMLNRLGIRLLAISLDSDDETQLRYTAQKLPLEVARALAEMVGAEGARVEREWRQIVVREAEAVAVSLRRAKTSRQRQDKVNLTTNATDGVTTPDSDASEATNL